MPRHRVVILTGLLAGAAMVTVSMWLAGLSFYHRLEIHPAWILLVQAVGGWGVLLRQRWGFAVYWSLAVFLCLPALIALGSDFPMPAESQLWLVSVLVAANLYAWSSERLTQAQRVRFSSRGS